MINDDDDIMEATMYYIMEASIKGPWVLFVYIS